MDTSYQRVAEGLRRVTREREALDAMLDGACGELLGLVLRYTTLSYLRRTLGINQYQLQKLRRGQASWRPEHYLALYRVYACHRRLRKNDRELQAAATKHRRLASRVRAYIDAAWYWECQRIAVESQLVADVASAFPIGAIRRVLGPRWTRSRIRRIIDEEAGVSNLDYLRLVDMLSETAGEKDRCRPSRSSAG